MAKVRNLSDTQQQIAFTEHDFYQLYVETFKTSELGRIKSLLPLREMAISFGLIEEKPKSIRVKRGRKSFFSPENQLTNYKLIDSILLELSKKLKIQEQQKNHFKSGDSRESIPNRIVSLTKPHIRPIVSPTRPGSLMFHAWNATLREWWLPT